MNNYRFNTILPLTALSLGFFMVIIDVTIVNVALPSIASSLQGGIAWLQWVVDGYTLTFACLLLSAGNLADRLGAKSAFLYGLMLFMITSLGCGLTTNFWQLIFFRLLQGTAAAFLVPTSLALIHASYENNHARAKAIGIWATIGGIAAASGPLLGGILTTWLGWRSVFFVNVPVAIIALVLTQKYVPNPQPRIKANFDYLGQILAIVSIAALAFSLIEAGRLGWFSSWVIMSFCTFIISFIVFLSVEHRHNAPMLPLKLFQSSTFSTAIAIAMILNVGAYGELFVLTLYFQHVRAFSALITGFAFLPLLGITAIASYYGGKMTSITGPRAPMMIGFCVGALGFLTMLMASATIPYVLLVLPLMAIGFGAAFTVPAATVAAMHATPDNTGIAAGTLNASRQIGSLMGVAIFGTLINAANYFIAGMHVTLLIAAVLFLIGCGVTFLWIKT